MLNLKTIKARNGQSYALRLSHQIHLSSSVTPESFWDDWAALQFVRSLDVIETYWQYLASSCLTFSYEGWRNSNPWSDIENYIALCLVRGSLKAFKVNSSETLRSTAAKRQFKTPYGREFQFLPAANLLTETSVEAQPISNIEAAKSAINELNLSDEQLIDLAKSLQLPVPTTSANNGQALEITLAEKIAKGEVVIALVEESARPQPKMEIVEEVKKSADLGPHVSQGTTTTSQPTSSQSKIKTSPTPTQTQIAQAGTLTNASKEGQAFCEECNKEDSKAA